jgi:uncharacterized protein YutE (UPF0331/DUF86 family)
MEKRIKSKMEDIEVCLAEIESWIPEELEDYEKDAKTRKACEKNFEIISEYILDIALYLIRYKKFRTPKDDESTFNILAENNIIKPILCEKMIEIRGMRNFIAHRYGEVDNARVFHALKEQFSKDVEEFIESVNKEI